MTKRELFNHLKTIKDKSGGFKKEESIKKNYPELYEEMCKISFPINYTFTQKLWHFLQDDFEIHKCKCGNELHFIDFKKGYRTYCSKNCPCVLEYNKSTISKAQEISRREESRKKAVETIINKNGGKFWSDENLEKLHNNYIKNKENRCLKIQEKIKQNIDEYVNLTETKIKGSTSKIEIEFYKYLINLFGKDNIIIQYYNEQYPYSCDFFIKHINLYIEIQGNWTHGQHQFDENNTDDIYKLNQWKTKNNDYYNNAIYTWTDLDVRKRNIAQNNKLNYLEIFSHKITDCICIFEDYLKTIIVDYCFLQSFPGTNKWKSNHPIWDCNVGNRMSPKEAWKDKNYLLKSITNIFYVCEIDDIYKKRFINEFLKCKIYNNTIVESTHKFLEYILNRFTIAKIAPKVTALRPNVLKDIIINSGIDISGGVYVPMAGFGGIVECIKQISKDIDIEAYDINPDFCKWYGWVQKDMLSHKVKTDKVVICCPPFGKEFEHWKNTPREMSDKPFKEWYRLIKEYIDAPYYIIIGPEINSKENINGLFIKKNGIMLWDDDMIKKC